MTASPALLTKEAEFALSLLRPAADSEPDAQRVAVLRRAEAAALLQHIAALEQRAEAADALVAAADAYCLNKALWKPAPWKPMAEAVAAYRALPKEPPRDS